MEDLSMMKILVGDETKGLEIGAVDYLTKPISPPIVQARVKAQLERKKQKDKLKKAHEIIETQKERMETELRAFKILCQLTKS